MSLEVQAKSVGEDIVVTLSGQLGEDTEFPKLNTRLSQRVILECDKISHLSSFAGQSWSNWMHKFDSRQQFVFRGVPPRVVDIFNLIEGFLPLEATIESFFVPYECETCGNEEDFLVKRGKDYLEAMNGEPAKLLFPTEINCQKCKNAMRLGVWKEKFLRFLDHNQKEQK
jgi:anti-anti-sigma regulatory factor